jgi:DNA-binding XRE family transcriptional regulator
VKDWSDVKREIKSLNNADNKELDFALELVSEIVKRRMELGLTQSDLARISGVKQPAIARLENLGAIPRIDTLMKIIGPLGLKIKLVRNESSCP